MSSAAPSSVTPIRVDTAEGPVELLDALVADPAAEPQAFEALAAAHAVAWAAATVLAALARIADAERDGSAAEQLVAVADGDIDEAAVAVARGLGNSVQARVANVALLSASRHDSDVLALTHGVELGDDVTALLLIYRATALARFGMVASAREAIDRVVHSRRRHPAVRAFARRQRDTTWSRERIV